MDSNHRYPPNFFWPPVDPRAIHLPQSKPAPSRQGPMVRIHLPPAGSLLRTPIEPGADPRSKSASSTARFKHDGGRDADRFHRKPVGDEHGGDVRQHHAERCADDDRIEGREPRGEADRGDLGLVTDFGEEKSAKGCHECTCASDLLITALILVWKQ